MCAGFTVNAGGAVCSSLTRGGETFGITPESWLKRDNLPRMCRLTGLEPPDRDSLKAFFSFPPPPLYVSQCFDIMSKLYVLLSNIWGAPLNQRDLTTRWANLHCVNTKWVIWKRCWHVGLCRKEKKRVYIFSKCPCSM